MLKSINCEFFACPYCLLLTSGISTYINLNTYNPLLWFITELYP